MLKLKNLGPCAFREYIKDKNVYIFGAGRALESCVDLYFSEKKVRKVIDNNVKIWNTSIKYRNQEMEIIGINGLLDDINQFSDRSKNILMISSVVYAAEIVEMLDKIPELNGMECFLQVIIRNTKEPTESFDFTKGKQKIPKKIHYIWVGEQALPYEFEQNIESWKKYNPDYEIICWNESNYDFKKCDYMKEAYTSQSWGFVPNYARLDIIYQYGGIYLDTDVEVIKSLDPLLNDDAFICMGTSDRLNQGCGFGAKPGNLMIYDMMQAFEESHFLLANGKPSKRSCHMYIHPVVRKYGFKISNIYQKIDNIVLYPSEVMSPLTIDGMENFFSEKTVSIHKETGQWRTEREKEGLKKLERLVQNRMRG